MKKEIISILETVLEDCQSQADSLKERQDIYWDCYDAGNWQAMADNLAQAIKKIKRMKND